MAKGAMRSEALEATRRARIARQQQSGRTGRAFCREEELKESAFYYWRRELSRRDGQRSGTSVQRAGRQPGHRSASSFLPITVASTTPAPLEIALPGGVFDARAAVAADGTFFMTVTIPPDVFGWETAVVADRHGILSNTTDTYIGLT